MACGGCAERQRQIRRVIEAAQRRDAEMARDATNKFMESVKDDAGRLVQFVGLRGADRNAPR